MINIYIYILYVSMSCHVMCRVMLCYVMSCHGMLNVVLRGT